RPSGSGLPYSNRLSLAPLLGVPLNPPDSLHIPRSTYGLWMAVATAVALALAWFVAVGMKGNTTAAGMAVATLGIGSLLTFGPALMKIERERWGVMVLVFGAARGLTA